MLHSTGLPTEDGKFFYIGNTHEVQRCHISTAHMSGSESMAWEYMPKLHLHPDRHCITHIGQQS